MEIERKFTVMKLPENLEQYEKREIEQGYLCTNPVVRIRKMNEDYILTYKSKEKGKYTKHHARCCEEVELPLTKGGYFHLKEKADGNIISKTRYLIPTEDAHKIELDIFHGHLEGLVFAEIEFESEEAAANYPLPDWFQDDVTFDRHYSNAYMTKFDSLKELFFDQEEK